jgi:hypothetical protein
MKRVLKTFVISGLIVSLSGCLYGQCLDGPCAFERAKMIESIKPYGAHWIKKGMTRESRWDDYVECGGSFDLREGYEIKPNQTNEDFFKGFNVHTYDVFSCMKSKNYAYLHLCDARCLYP